MSPSSVTIGLASLAVFCVCVQPAIGSTRTEAIGASVGRLIVSPTVSTFFSTGTRKVISWSLPPRVAPGAVTVTCAAAGIASASSPANARTVRTARRFMASLSVQGQRDLLGGGLEGGRGDDERDLPVAGDRQGCAAVVEIRTFSAELDRQWPELLLRLRRGRGHRLRAAAGEFDGEVEQPGHAVVGGDGDAAPAAQRGAR